MTREQISAARALIGKMPAREIASELGVSMAALKRAFRGTRLAFYNKYVVNPSLVRAVCRYYEKHGRRKTEEHFAGYAIRVRSIVERYKHYKPRQSRWKDDEIIDAIKMAGLVSMKSMAKYFDRPNAHVGSIKSFFMKRIGFGGGSIHGMSYSAAREIVKSHCRGIRTGWWSRRDSTAGKAKQRAFSRRIIPWCVMERELKNGVPANIRLAIRTMAQFQRWIYRPEDPEKAIRRIIRQKRP